MSASDEQFKYIASILRGNLHGVALRLYKYISSDDSQVESELKKLGEIIRTRSQLNRDLEYIIVTKVSSGEVKGLIMIRGDEEKVTNEADVLLTIIKSTFNHIDADVTPTSQLAWVAQAVKNFL